MLRRSQLWVLTLTLTLGAASSACERTPPEVKRPSAPNALPPSPSASAAAPKASSEPEPAREPGQGDAEIPFDFPAVQNDAPVGGYVLAPPRSWIDAAVKRGTGKQTFIYYGGWMKTPGPTASEIETLTKQSSVIPNALIISIPRSQRAKPGDVVLTSWASGTGMQRAIVVQGESEATPRVRYLDMSLDSPTGWGEREDTLPANTFVRLERPGQVGTTAVCKRGSRHMHYVVTARSGDRLLGYGFAGHVAAFDAGDCSFLPIHPRFNKGEAVYVPVVGRYVRATVRKVDGEVGRAWAKYKTEDEDRVVAIALLDVAHSLE